MVDPARTGAISPSPDDLAGRRRSGGAPRRRGGAGGGSERTGGSRLFGNTILVVLIAGLVVAGWFIARQYQRLEQESTALADAQARLEVLEDRLRVTDEALTERGETTSEQLNFWETETRKLWDNYKRNRTWIEENQKAVKSLQQSLSGLQSSNRELASTIGRHESMFEEQQQLVDHLNSIQMQLQQLSRSQRDLVDRVNAAQQTVARLESGLAGRVEKSEQAIEAFDAYRLQLNSRLADIERRVNSLAASATL